MLAQGYHMLGKMNTILYTTIFIIGTLFGSFFTLAVYRIPRKKDITHTHSFCPNCNHKLGFFELIPVLSYIFLGGKCKNCKQKIRPRYLILEILSGITFVIMAYIFKIDANNFDINVIVKFSSFVLYLCAIFIIAGIANESKKIEKSVLYYSVAVALVYIVYLCIIDATSIYRYAMYLAIVLVLLVVDLLILKNKAKNNSVIQTLLLVVVMAIFAGELVTSASIFSTIIWIGIQYLERVLKNYFRHGKKEQSNLLEQLNIPFYLCWFNIIEFIFVNI